MGTGVYLSRNRYVHTNQFWLLDFLLELGESETQYKSKRFCMCWE